jgi:hypothetical protein
MTWIEFVPRRLLPNCPPASTFERYFSSKRLIMNIHTPADSGALLLNIDGPMDAKWRKMAADPKEGDGTDGTDGDGVDGDGDGTDGTDGDGVDGDGTDGADGDGTDGAH